MHPKIALLTYPYSADYLREIAEQVSDCCEVEVIEFQSQSGLLKLIPQIADKYDGICVYSALLRKFLQELLPGIATPIQYLDRTSVNFFKTFFLMLSENRDIDFSRVVIDTSLIRREKMRSLDEIVSDLATFERERDNYLAELTPEDFFSMESRLTANAIQLWRQGRFDILVCRSGSVAEAMQREGIPHVFVYPEKSRVVDILDRLIQMIQINKMSDGFPASIVMTSTQTSFTDFQEISPDSVKIQKALLEFSKSFAANFTIQRSSQGYEVLTSQLVVKGITNHFTSCQLKRSLVNALKMEINIGYGIGHDIMTARQNALQAVRAAETTGASCIVTATGSLHSMQTDPDSRETADSKEDLEAANRTGLSAGTVQRIRSAIRLLGTNELTTSDLAGVLQVTVANANRFMNTLEKNGAAEIVAEKKLGAKGRPSRVYRINL